MGFDPLNSRYTVGANEASGTVAMFITSLAVATKSMALTWIQEKQLRHHEGQARPTVSGYHGEARLRQAQGQLRPRRPGRAR